MAKLILMRGLPGSGKSTRAKEIMKADGTAIRVNRDLLREMFHFNHWSGRNEGRTIDGERVLILSFLLRGCTVIVDDTNLNPKTLESLKALARGHKVEVVDMDTPWQECVERDEARQLQGERYVGSHVVINMARQYGLYEYTKPDIICDIDGTLADIDHRLHFVKNTEKKDWKSFFENISQDTPRQEIVDFVNDKAKTHNIVLVSGRPAHHKEETIKWLKKHGVIYQTLMMRDAHDSRDDDVVKKEILDKHWGEENKKHIELVIDDRPRVIRMWEANGIPVMDVGSGVEF